MKRLLPPLVVVLILGVVAWRVSQDPRRERERGWIQAQWHTAEGDPHRTQQIAADIERYLERYGHVEADRWFAARAFMELGVPAAGFEAIWGAPDLRAQPDTARRLADLFLRTVGFHDPHDMMMPRAGANLVTMALADGGNARAAERITEVARNEPWQGFLDLYYGVATLGLQPSTRALLDGLRGRSEEELTLATAIIALGPDAYTDREDDLKLLGEVVPSDWRNKHPLAWGLSAFALGRSGDEASIELVGEVVKRLRASEDPKSRVDGQLAATGLIAAGRWSAEDVLESALAESRPDAIKDWYLQALIHRVREGDAKGLERLRSWWDETKDKPKLLVQPRVILELFLREDLPAEDAPTEIFLARAREDGQTDEVARMLTDAVDLRRGKPGAQDRLIGFLQRHTAEMDVRRDQGFSRPMSFSPSFHAARALFLYDR